MYQVDFHKPLHLHFIGIGGISMSGLAEILLQEGFRISGSDSQDTDLTKKLTDLGAEIVIGQKAENIKPGIDAVIYTAAIHPDNPEFKAAKDANVPMLTRAQLLGEIMRNYELPIAVSGTHGKTTTTAMVSHILLAGGLDPTISIGGILPSIGGNIRVGHSGTFVAEACEYTNSFLSFFPKISLILNVDADHLDFFKDIDDIANSFHKFAALLPEDGTLIIDKDTPKYPVVVKDITCEILTYSMKDSKADYTASGISYDDHGCGTFTCMEKGKPLGTFSLNVPGAHNISNALASIALGRKTGLSYEQIAEGLKSFQGTDRRFEYKGKVNGVTIIDDYAHHPTEIAATLTAAKQYPHKSIWVAFQPHTYTRTKALLPEFADALSKADHIVLADIYAAREKNTIGISSDDLRKEIAKKGTDVRYFSSFSEIEDYLKKNCVDGDLLITMGAGSITNIASDLLK
ncbi:MAG TPA: UDP-N-acetylmuramate--L-alanine ligase [Lachnospiraceae bacterium]|nr:UDP-N-acetylmuramate--L-alanine ligase [Lachnospiraceae bacterium]